MTRDTLREWVLVRPPKHAPLTPGDHLMTVTNWNDGSEVAQ